jgi:hypothetical protein
MPKEAADDWILILDESVGVGQEKLLVILGIRRSKLPKNRPLTLQDMSPLIVKSRTHWDHEAIKNELDACHLMLGGKILYATTDGGANIKKALVNSHIPHVYDLTHAIAVMLSRIYEKEETFKKFTTEMALMRSKLCRSKYAFLIPPNQRTKSRFLNIDIISNWGMKVLGILENKILSGDEEQELLWVKEYTFFIKEMNSIINSIESVSLILKHEGLSARTAKACRKAVGSHKGFPKHLQFKRLFVDYLTKNLMQRSRRKESLLCTSDVIESTFGRYKNELNANPMSGITDMSLIIPALTSNLDEAGIKEAIDSCTCAQLKKWREQNLCESLQAKRNRVLRMK